MDGAMSVIINGTTGISGVDGSASTPAVQGADTNTGVFFPAADTIAFAEGGTEAMRIDSSGRVGINTTSPSALLNVSVTGAANGSTTDALILNNTNSNSGDNLGTGISWMRTGNNASYIYTRIASIRTGTHDTDLAFSLNNGGTLSERARIASDGTFFIGKTVTTLSTAGTYFYSYGEMGITRNGSTALLINRTANDGTLVEFYQDGVNEGNISVSGSTVSYNGGHLSRWAQMLTKPDLLKGTVMSNLDEMNVYIAPTTYWTEEDELPEGVNVGDVKVEEHAVDNEQLNKVKISDVEGDVNVAGVFVNWEYDKAHQVDEINMAMTGDMIIRIAQGVVVQKGDLLMSAGDGTAKPQGDDIVRSKTVAKVTSNHVTCTYEDGSYCVPCVLMAC